MSKKSLVFFLTVILAVIQAAVLLPVAARGADWRVRLAIGLTASILLAVWWWRSLQGAEPGAGIAVQPGSHSGGRWSDFLAEHLRRLQGKRRLLALSDATKGLLRGSMSEVSSQGELTLTALNTMVESVDRVATLSQSVAENSELATRNVESVYDSRAEQIVGYDQKGGPADQQYRQPDQSSGLECDHRGGPRRGGRPRIFRCRLGGPDTGQSNRIRGRADSRPDRRHSVLDSAVGRCGRQYLGDYQSDVEHLARSCQCHQPADKRHQRDEPQRFVCGQGDRPGGELGAGDCQRGGGCGSDGAQGA